MTGDSGLNPAAVELGCFFPQPREVVWNALIDPDLLERWMVRPTGFEPTVGTHFLFNTPAIAPGEVACEVLIARPLEQLAYSWTYSLSDPPATWTIDWTLRAQGRGTRLLLTQTGFDIEDRRQRMQRNAMERSWRNTLPRLGDWINS
ncbi:SRPBCC domain-containing protein [Nocardia sp. NPDC005978]|uniref:SRPBCC family protein n=1 Tax=unclassified Nocardia TaxID=2637762 RepID=UPI0033B5F179